jgi:feruloyl esterase
LRNIQNTLGNFREQRRKWDMLLQSTARMRSGAFNDTLPSSHLVETRNFGSNPGALRMFTHVPEQMSEDRALVVVLHGCTQSAAGYDLGAGWSTLADRFGFAVLLPEQQRSNNPNGCFNWFQVSDTQREQGEALSIRQMVEKAISDHGINPARVFVTGLSAGGAMTSVMLATYPDVFAAGAIVAGLPYGAATSVQQAFETMFQCPPRAARAWGDLVRRASPHKGPWPRISVWHGGADATVIPSNAQETIKQWVDVHGLPPVPSVRSIVDGYPRHVWLDGNGEEVIESYTITGMAHGTPLATRGNGGECGAAGPFLLEVGISSSYHIAKFFGLASADFRISPTISEMSGVPEQLSTQPEVSTSLKRHVLEGEVLGPEVESAPEFSRTQPLPIDIGAVINNALKAAGLMRGN